MKLSHQLLGVAATAAMTAALPSWAAVSADEAAKLKGELTPLGAQKAGNADGSIPPWTGGMTTPVAGDKAGGRRGDPFKGDKPLLSITARNADQYADKLTDGTKAMLKKYPDSFRVDVYKTHRTMAAPQWVYDNTFKNATRGKLDGAVPKGVYGGIPFPIPKTGEEVMWNHILRWNGISWNFANTWYQLTTDGRAVMVSDNVGDQQFPYYYPDGNADAFEKGDGNFWYVRIRTNAPALRAGEALLAHENIDPNKLQTWVYLTGQRRVRKLPNACCDAPTPAAAAPPASSRSSPRTRPRWRPRGRTVIGGSSTWSRRVPNSPRTPASGRATGWYPPLRGDATTTPWRQVRPASIRPARASRAGCDH